MSEQAPPLARPLSLTLPRAPARTAALLAPTLGAPPVHDLHALRGRLLSTLPPLVTEAGLATRLVIDGYQLALALHRPDRCRPDEGFVISPMTCRRAIGLVAAKRTVHGRSSSPAVATADVLAEAISDVAAGASELPWWAPWYAGLNLGTRAAVEAEAATWATELWTALDWKAFPRPAVIGGADWWWNCPGTTRLALHARAEVRTWVGEQPVCFVVAGGVPSDGWRVELAFPALVAALARGPRSLPARVMGWWPSTGQARVVDIDRVVLHETVDAVIASATVWARALASPSPDRISA